MDRYIRLVSGLPIPLQHLIVALLTTGLVWAGNEGVPLLRQQQGLVALAAPLVAVVVAWATPIITTFGAGSRRASRLRADQGDGDSR